MLPHQIWLCEQVGFGLGYLAFRLAALWQWQRPVYLLNFQVFKPPER